MTRGALCRATLFWAAVAVTAMLVPSSNASTAGPCQLLLNGVDVSQPGARVEADGTGNLTYSITAPQPVTHLRVVVKYGPFSIPALDQEFPNDQKTRTGTTSLSQVGKYGSGLYEVVAEATLADGTSCRADVGVKVPGSVLASPLGLVAVGLVGAGAVGLLATLISLALQINDLRSTVQDFVVHMREAKGQVRPASTDATRGGGPRASTSSSPGEQQEGTSPHDAAPKPPQGP